MTAGIVAGDPAALAAAYDHYAAALYAYCRSLHTEPEDAADAVQNTFVVAAAKLRNLRDRDRLRPWLYAVARNECHRGLRDEGQAGDGAAATGDWPDETGDWPDVVFHGPAGAGDATGEPVDVTVDSRRSEPRELVSGAFAALSPGDRDVAELSLRHDLKDADLAAIFGASRRQVHAAASRARRQFEAALGALLVASFGHEFCAGLGALVVGWDGELSAARRTLLNRHQKRCPKCGARKRRELPHTMLTGLLPVLTLPEGLRPQVIRLVTDASEERAANRTQIAERAERFGKSGFPVPLDPPALTRAPKPSVLAPMIGLVALVALGAGTVIVTDLPHHGGPSDGTRPVLGVQGTGPATAQQTLPASTPTGAPRAPGRLAAPAGPAAVPAQTVPSTSSAFPTSPVARGTLTVSPATVTLRRHGKGGRPTGSFTLTANGGPVTAFSITVSADDAGVLIVTPVTGSLAAGQSVQVVVTVRKGYNGQLNTQLDVQPDGLTVTIAYLLRPR